MINNDKSQDNSIFAENLKILVKEVTESKDSKITKEMIAKGIGIKPQTLSKYFKDPNPNLKMETLISIADYFHVTTDWLLGRSKARNPENEYIVREFGLSSAAADITRKMSIGAPVKESTFLEDFNPPLVGERKPGLLSLFRTIIPEYDVPFRQNDLKTDAEITSEKAEAQLKIINEFIESGAMELYYGFLNSVPCQLLPYLSKKTVVNVNEVDSFWMSAIIDNLKLMRSKHLKENYDTFEIDSMKTGVVVEIKEFDHNGRAIN